VLQLSNYAFERRFMDVVTNRSDSTDYLLATDLRAWCPAQRER